MSNDRDPVAEALQGLAPDRVLTGYLCIMEWVDSDGARALSTVYPTGSPPWERAGWLHYITHEDPDDWDFDLPDSEETDDDEEA